MDRGLSKSPIRGFLQSAKSKRHCPTITQQPLTLSSCKLSISDMSNGASNAHCVVHSGARCSFSHFLSFMCCFRPTSDNKKTQNREMGERERERQRKSSIINNLQQESEKRKEYKKTTTTTESLCLWVRLFMPKFFSSVSSVRTLK